MKQQLTREEWYKEDKKHLVFWNHFNTFDNNITAYEAVHRPPNIGEMIEFLGEDWYDDLFEIGVGCPDEECNCCPDYIIKKYKGELCDALWEACKYKLNQ